MKSRASLVLMEQIVMIFVFALSAAICLQLFAASDRISRHNEARDNAVLLAQTTAEEIRYGKGLAALRENPSGYTADWEPCSLEEATYTVTAEAVDSGIADLGEAIVRVHEKEDILFALSIRWQEGENGA